MESENGIDGDYLRSQKREYRRSMRELVSEFGTNAEKRELERTSRRHPILKSKTSQSEEDTMKVKSMRGLLARLQVSLHYKEKQKVIKMISDLSKTMNRVAGEKEETSKEISHDIHIHDVQKHHLEHQILDDCIEEDIVHKKEMELENNLNIMVEQKNEKLDRHKIAIYADEATRKVVTKTITELSLKIAKAREIFEREKRKRHDIQHSIFEKREKIKGLITANENLQEKLLTVLEQEKLNQEKEEENNSKVDYLKRRSMKAQHKKMHNNIRAKMAADRRMIQSQGRSERQAQLRESFDEKMKDIARNCELQRYHPEKLLHRKHKIKERLIKVKSRLSNYVEKPLELSPRPYTSSSTVEDRSIVLQSAYPLKPERPPKRPLDILFPEDRRGQLQKNRRSVISNRRRATVFKNHQRKEFQVGQYVWANWRGHNDWYSATVCARNVDGNFYEVLYDDGEMEIGVPYVQLKDRENDGVDCKVGHEAVLDKQSRLHAQKSVDDYLGFVGNAEKICKRARNHNNFGSNWREQWDNRRREEIQLAHKMGLMSDLDKAKYENVLKLKVPEDDKKDFILDFLDKNPNGQSPRFWIPPEHHKVVTVGGAKSSVNQLIHLENSYVSDAGSNSGGSRKRSSSSVCEEDSSNSTSLLKVNLDSIGNPTYVSAMAQFGRNIADAFADNPYHSKSLSFDESISEGLKRLKSTALSSKVNRPKNKAFIKSLYSRKPPKKRGRTLRTMKQAGDQRPFSPSGKNYYGVVECGQRPKSPKGHIFNTKAMPPTSADSLRDRTMPWINTIKSFLSSQ
jgi:hypothetical protein